MKAALVAVMLCAACAGSTTSTTTGGDAAQPELDAGMPDAAMPEADAGSTVDAGPAYLAAITSEADFESLQGMMGEVKFLARVAGVTPQAPLVDEECLFQDTVQFPYHLQFLRTFPGHETMTNSEYIALVLRASTRVWWGGGVQHSRNRVHPLSMRHEVIAYTIYADNAGGAGLREQDIRDVDGILKRCMGYATDILAFQPGDPYQMTLATQVKDALAVDGIAVLTQ